MNLLAFDTSTEVLSLALEKSGQILEVSHQGIYEHSEKIIPLMQNLLEQAGLDLADINAFLIGEGPGSFTGLRVGFATLIGFSEALGKPCYGAPSLDITAQANAACHAGLIAVVMDARREKVYMGLYEADRGRIRLKSPYSCDTPENAARAIYGVQGTKSVLVAGDAIKKYAAIFQESLHNAQYAPAGKCYPEAHHLIALFHERKRECKPKGPSEFLPLYLSEPVILR
ncbi:MAG: tRNA (adenosine(37)-N6)-threonylcarbamoyltransferase complex dimerization subunit type 1 TsaB [Candidatus Omnitrophica bacterium]|nr:tRNA (adenosine(37)-N6)-threonylcarbamoyltransferase complex dimerization subunit type 1 TsaB [Candidatus Omnitrophota bacterium]